MVLETRAETETETRRTPTDACGKAGGGRRQERPTGEEPIPVPVPIPVLSPNTKEAAEWEKNPLPLLPVRVSRASKGKEQNRKEKGVRKRGGTGPDSHSGWGSAAGGTGANGGDGLHLIKAASAVKGNRKYGISWLVGTLLAAALICLVTVVFSLERAEQVRLLAKHDAFVFVERFAAVVGAILSRSASTTFQLAETPCNFTEKFFLSWAGKGDDVVQLRHLDESAQELLRVNVDPSREAVRPATELQNKAHRYYSRAALALPAQSFFVTPIDLNEEYGKVEVPWVPVYRVATPRFCPYRGTRDGFVVVNYDADRILMSMDSIGLVFGGARGDFNILSESLHFLASSSSSIGPSDLFGHSLNASRERTFDRQHPEEAEAIRGTVEQLKKKEQAEGDERKGGVETATLRRRDGGVSAFTIIDFCRVQSVNAVENLSPRCRLVDGNYAALVIGVITISGEKMNEAINRDLLLVFIIAPPCLILLLILSGVLFLNYEKSVKIRQAQHSHTFLSSLAHDLRAPLNVMRFALDMMDGATIRAMYSYRALHTSIDSMVNLMSNVTFAYKLDSIKACPPQARNLRDDLTALAESFSFLANPKGIFVDVDIDYNLPSVVFVDWPAVQQVLSNLLSNAIKFTSEGGVVLRCSTDSSSFSPSSSASLVSSFSAGGRGGWGRSKKKRSGERREREREQPPRSVHRLPLSILSMQATGEGFFYRQNPNCPPEPPPEPLQASDLTQRREGFKSPFPPQTQQLPKARDQDCSENAGGAQIHEGGECVEKKVRGEWLQQNNAESDMHTASSPTHRLSARIAQKSPPNNKALHTLPLPCSMPPTQTLSSQEKEKEKKAIRGQGGGGGAGGRGGTDFLSQSVNSSSPSQAVSFMLTFAVDDSGPGMSETDPEKVGLGFCITNRIVKALGGRLSIKALTPRGTRVLIHSMPCSGHSEPLRANVSPSRGGLSDYACGLSISPSPAACLLLPSVRHVIGVSSARGRGAVLEQRGSGGGGGGGVSVSSSSDEGEGPPGLGECSGLLPFSSRSLEMEAMEESRVNHFVSLMAAPTTVSWTDLPTLLGKCQGRSSRVGRHQGRTLTEEGEGGEGKHEGGWRAQKERIAVPEGRMELFPSSSSPVPEKRPPVPPVEAPPFCIGGNWKEDRGQGVDGGDGREASGSSSSSSNKEAKRKSGSAEEGKVGGRNREEYPPSHPDGHSPPSSSSSSSDGGPSESRRSKEMMPQQLKDERGEGKGIDRDGDRDPRQPSWGAQAEAQANGERGRRRRRKTGETGKPSGRLPLPLEGTLVVLSSRLAELDGIPLSLFSPPETEAEGAVETPSASPCVQGGGGEGDTGGVCHFRILVETVRCVLEAGGGCICLSLAGGQGGLPDSILTEVGPRRVVFPPWTVSRLAEGAKHAREPLTCPSQPSEGPAAETKERGEEVLELMREGHQKGPSAEVSVTRLRGDQSRGQVVRPGFRVCVVDDDAMSREILVMLLQEKFGVTACEAKSGEVFLSLLDRGARFDLVLLDQHMPRGMGGCECARAVRARGLASPFPVVVGLSGDGSPEIVGECLGSGMDFFRQKPVGMGVLEGLLTEVRALSPACPN